MATTVVLHANDTHKTEQSPHSIQTSSPLVRGYSPSQTSVYNIAGVSPTEGTTPINCSSSNYQQASYPLPPTRDAFQDLTPEPPPEDCPSQVPVCQANFIGSSTDNSDVTFIRDPFYEPPRPRLPSTSQPPAWGNSGDPNYSHVRLDLPRNVRVPYPESAYEAVIALNKGFAQLQSSAAVMCPPARGRPVQYMAAPQRGVFQGGMNQCGVSPSYPAPTPSPSGMSPSYMQQVRAMGCPKPCSSQMMSAGPYAFPNVPYAANNVMPATMKKAPSTGGGRKKVNKAAVDDRAAKTMRKMDYNVPCGNMYEQMGDIGRPSTSTANNFAPMPAVMGTNPANMSGQPSSTPSPPNAQMMMHGGMRTQFPYDGAMLNNNNPNMQLYQQQMQPPMNNHDCGGLMQPPPVPGMRPNGQMNTSKPGVDVNQMGKPVMFQQSAGMNPDMQSDGIRMFDGRSMEKNPQYQMHTMVSTPNEAYGNMNGIMSNSSGFPQSGSGPQRCGLCKEELRQDTPSIQCIGNGQGCFRYFHQSCSNMMAEAFQAIMTESRAEWICNDCNSRNPDIVYS